MGLLPAAVGRGWGVLLLCMLTGGPVWSQPGAAAGKLTRDDREMAAALYVDLDRSGHAQIHVSIGPQETAGGAVDWQRLPDEKTIVTAVEHAIGGPLQRIRTSVDEEGWLLTAESGSAFARRYLRVRGCVEGAPFADALANDGMTNISITLTHPKIGAVATQPEPHPDPEQHDSVEIQTFLQTAYAKTPTTIRVDYGYRIGDVLRVLGTMAMFGTFPLAAIFWLRRRALRVTEADPTAVWFSFARWSQYVINAFWLTWSGCIFGLGWFPFWDFAFNGSSRQTTALGCFSLLLGAPLLIGVLCAGLSQPVYARLRGVEMTAFDLMRQTFWAYLALVLPLIMFLAGLAALGQNLLPSMALWFGCAFFGRRLLAQHSARVRQIVPQAITSGELRDRIFALAGQAGVKLGQIYLLSAGRMRSANAFAMAGNNVLLTDYLLERLSKREIDVVMAHELGHLRHRHSGRLRAALFVCIVLPIAVLTPFIGEYPGFEKPAYVLLPVLVLAGMLVYYTISRRFERVADAEAVQLTSDAPAFIAALAKITRLNMMPLACGRDGMLFTHPSTQQRIERIAQLGGVPHEQLPEIMAASAADSDHYLLPVAASDAEEPYFSTMYKYRWSQTTGWVSLWITILMPALFALADRFAPVPAAIAWLYWPAGFVVTAALMLLAEDRLGACHYPELARKIAQRLARESVPPPGTEGYDVQFAPDPTPRTYEGFTNWDIGLLVLTGDRLCYLGEQTRFALSRAQIVNARIGPGFPALQPRPTLYITWRAPAADTDSTVEQTFHMRSAASGTLRGISRDTVALARRVQAWRMEPDHPTALPPALTEPGVPERQSVTSTAPRALATISNLLSVTMLKTILTLGVCIVFTLSLQLFRDDRFTPGQGWYVLIVTTLCTVLQFLPLWRYRERTMSRQQFGLPMNSDGPSV